MWEICLGVCCLDSISLQVNNIVEYVKHVKYISIKKFMLL